MRCTLLGKKRENDDANVSTLNHFRGGVRAELHTLVWDKHRIFALDVGSWGGSILRSGCGRGNRLADWKAFVDHDQRTLIWHRHQHAERKPRDEQECADHRLGPRIEKRGQHDAFACASG